MKKLVVFATLFLSFNLGLRSQFLPRQSFPAGDNPFSIAAGDFNDDRDIDLIVARLSSNARSGHLSLLSGTGRGGFAHFHEFAEKGAPEWVAVGDFNRDGNLDAVTPELGGKIAVFLGDGHSGFAAPVSYRTEPNAGFITVTDLNNDGKLDAIVANDHAGPSGTAIGILFGNGDGTFQREMTYETGEGPDFVAFADVNSDGKVDLIVANEEAATISILLGNGDGTFQPHVDYPSSYLPQSIAVGDYNHDGKLDLAVADAGKKPRGSSKGRVSLLFGNGDGTFQPEQFIEAGPFPYDIATADFDGDGNLDLALTNGGAGLALYLGKGDGTFLPATNYTTDSGPLGLTIADVDNDGLLDICIACRTSGIVDVFLNAGARGPERRSSVAPAELLQRR